MEAAHTLQSDDNYCPNCGDWFIDQAFDFNEGWCRGCASSLRAAPTCSRCGRDTDGSRTMCEPCRKESWLERNADDVELLVVTKGYSVYFAIKTVSIMVRPVCQCCHKPIVGGSPSALFCKVDKRCRVMYNRYRQLRRKGYTKVEAVREVTDGVTRPEHEEER